MSYINALQFCWPLKDSHAWSIKGQMNDMRTTRNILTVSAAIPPEKKVSAFKTIAFLVSSSENEPVTNFLENPSKDEGDHAPVPGPEEDWYSMDEFEGDTNSRKNLTFLNNKDNFPEGMSIEDVMFITVSFPSAGEKTLTASSPLRNSCRDIPLKKNDIVEYPGRSVLYSQKFRPLNRIITTEYKKPQSAPEPSGNKRADEDKSKED